MHDAKYHLFQITALMKPGMSLPPFQWEALLSKVAELNKFTNENPLVTTFSQLDKYMLALSRTLNNSMGNLTEAGINKM